MVQPIKRLHCPCKRVVRGLHCESPTCKWFLCPVHVFTRDGKTFERRFIQWDS